MQYNIIIAIISGITNIIITSIDSRSSPKIKN